MTSPSHRRRNSLRLAGWDYSRPGAYFLTLCVRDRKCRFGAIIDGEMCLNALGQVVRDAWFDLPNHHHHVVLDTFVVMPDHVHGIIRLVGFDESFRAGSEPAPTQPDTTDRARGHASGLGDYENPVGAGSEPAPTQPDTTDRAPSAGPSSAAATPSVPYLKRHAVPEIIRGFKTSSSRRINALRRTPATPVWQRGFYDHIVRDGRDLHRIREYIENNPRKWGIDRDRFALGWLARTGW